jgi:hypothetical protein
MTSCNPPLQIQPMVHFGAPLGSKEQGVHLLNSPGGPFVKGSIE